MSENKGEGLGLERPTVHQAARAQYEHFRTEILDVVGESGLKFAHALEGIIKRDGITETIRTVWLPYAARALENLMDAFEEAGRSSGQFPLLIQREPLCVDIRDTRNRIVALLDDQGRENAMSDGGVREWHLDNTIS